MPTACARQQIVESTIYWVVGGPEESPPVGGPINNVQYAIRGGVPGFTPSRSPEMLNTKEISAPGRRLARAAASGIHPIGSPGEFIPKRRLALAMREAAPAPARACEPAEAADSADPRARMKSPLYWLA